MKRKIEREELDAHFREQWGFLRKSCDAYDRGDESEAKRIAATLRLLLHSTKNSTALLDQLKLLDILFFDTAENIVESNMLPTFGLVFIHGTAKGARFVPPLVNTGVRPVWLIPFEYWWRKRVIRIPEEFDLTRRELVLLMANQDGGSHVDPEVDERYYRLTKENAMGHTVSVGDWTAPIEHIATASVRQIAQEVLTSLVKPLRMIPPEMPPSKRDTPPVQSITVDARTGVTTRRALEVRNSCMCNSGLLYQECHARGGRNEGKIVPPLSA